MKTENIYKVTAVILTAMFLGSCDLNELLDEESPHLTTAQTTFTNYDGFQSALAGINAEARQEIQWIQGYGNGLLFQNFYRMGTDVGVTNLASRFGLVAMEWRDTNNPDYFEYLTMFNWLYSMVNASNTVITRADNPDIDWQGGSAEENENNKNRTIAEARALRAWAYRHLSYLWGDVPLTLTESSGSDIRTDWERTPVDEVRDQIISDLRFAEQHLEVNPSIRGTITKGAVQHLLAEMYLAKEEAQPDSALYFADQVVSNPDYALITERYGSKADNPDRPVFMDMFLDGNTNREEGNTEALWVWQYDYTDSGGGAGSALNYLNNSSYWTVQWDGVSALTISHSRGGRGLGYYVNTKWAIHDNYEPQDDRASNYAIRKWFILQSPEELGPAVGEDTPPPGYEYGDTLYFDWSHNITYEDQTHHRDWPYSRKHEGAPESNLTTRNFRDHIVIRSAETYLLKAEAEYKLGQPQEAANTINHLRRRANASEVSAGDIDIDFILDERARELLDEENRRYHLLRTEKWLERTREYNHRGGQFIQERDRLLPIPQEVIDANLTGDMPQNPGY